MIKQLIVFFITIIFFACSPSSNQNEVITEEEAKLEKADTLPLSFIQKESKDRIKRDATKTAEPTKIGIENEVAN